MIKNYKFILILLFVSCFLSHAMENDSHLDYDTQNPEVVEMKGLLLEQHCYCVNNHHAPKINEHDDCAKTLKLIIKYCTILDYAYYQFENNNNDKRPSYSIRNIINNNKRGGKPCTCFKNDKIDLLDLAMSSNNTNKNKKRQKLPQFRTVQDRENRKNMESLKKLQISELLCNCENKKNYNYGTLIQIIIYINNIKNKYQKLKTKKDNCIFEKELNEKISLIFNDVNIKRKLNGLECNYQALAIEDDGSKMVKQLEKKINTLNKDIETKDKTWKNLLAIKKIIRLQHCNCFIEKGFFSIAKLPFKINVSNPEGKVILRELLKYMKLNVLSTPDLINFLELGPNVILPNTFSIYDKKDRFKRKKKLKQTSILGHTIRIIYKKSLIELYNAHFNTPFFLDRSTSDTKLNHWCMYADKNNEENKEMVNIINKDHLVILERLYDMSMLDKNFEFYKKQQNKGRSWLQTKRECFDPKDTLPEIIKGLNSKLFPKLYIDLIIKIGATSMKGYKAMSEDDFQIRNIENEHERMALSSRKVSKKLGADFITIIERIMNPYNLKNQPNIPPPFDKAKYIKQFSQKS